MKNYHKRFKPDREITFRAPAYNCHACNDSGIVHNSDGLINNYIPDYDIQDGVKINGSDLAIICWCDAAYPVYKDDGTVEKTGYRLSTNEIPNKQGIDVKKDVIRDIHNQRKLSWEHTEKMMMKINLARIKGEKTDILDPIAETKKKLKNAQGLLKTLR